MAGGTIRSTPIRSHVQRAPPRFRSRNLVNASLSVLGRTFRTTISEGASAEELIERIAKENGGGVAKVYYPEFKTWEIVAVKMGDRLLVKGDSNRVAEADFSQFPDAASVCAAAIAASKSSEGGIHFSLGESGIPMAATEELGVVFPNAEELRIGRNTSDIALWTTSATFDPQNLKDINDIYGGGSRVTKDALRHIASAHGGDRNEKILLHDNILVLDKDSGEIRTISEHASGDVRFMDAPVPPPLTLEPQTVTMHHPDMPDFDGRPERVSYLMVKTFDGAFTEHVQLEFHPLISIEQEEIPPQKPELAIPQPEFSLLVFDQPEAKIPEARIPKTKPPEIGRKAPGLKKPETRAIPAARRKQMIPTLASALVSWSIPRTEPIRMDTPKSVIPLIKAPKRKQVQAPENKLPEQGTKIKKTESEKRTQKKKNPETKEAGLSKAKKEKPKKKPKTKTKPRPKTKPKTRTAKKAMARKKPAPETISKKTKKGLKAKPKLDGKARRRIKETIRRTRKPRKKAKRKIARQSRKTRKKSHYLKELMGHPSVHWKTRGRKFRMKKTRAV